MKAWKRRLTLLVALLIALAPTLALAEGSGAQEAEYDPALVTFEGEAVLQSQVVDYAQRLYDAGYAEDARDYDQAIEYIVYEIYTAEAKMREYGLDQFTDEEQADFYAQAQAQLDEYYAEYVQYSAGEDATQEDLDALYLEAAEFYGQYGYTLDAVAEQLRNEESFNRLLDKMVIEVSEEEIAAAYAEYVDYHKQYFEGNIADYETYTMRYGYESYYIPEGYRAVIQILLEFDAADLEAYFAVADAENASETEIAEARQTLLATRQADIDDIYARVEAGEDFKTLIAEYNADPGMEGAALETGYFVHRESTGTYDEPFVNAAFAENMQKPGDVSEPFVGQYGAYIVCYLADVTPGAAEMSESARSSISASLFNQGVYNQLVAWAAEYDVAYDEEALAALKAGV